MEQNNKIFHKWTKHSTTHLLCTKHRNCSFCGRLDPVIERSW